jgi:hypothetical protein
MRYAMVMLLSLSSGPSTTNDCAVLPRPHMRVQLTLPDEYAAAATDIQAIVDATWAREGIVFDWRKHHDAPDAWEGIDLWIAAVPQERPSASDDILGEIHFRNGIPERLVRIFIDRAKAWVQRDFTDRLRVSGMMANVPKANPRWLARALGRIAAHEVGHFALATSAHAGTGLMQARYQRADLLLSANPLRLDMASRARLRARLAAGAACP